MSKLSLAKRIYLNSGVTLGLMAALAAVSLISAFQLGGVFTEYRHTARQTLALNAKLEDLLEARVAALKYRASGSEEAAAEVVANIGEVLESDALTGAFANDPAGREKLVAYKEEAKSYLTAFNKVQGKKKERDAIVARLSALGPQARKQLSDVMTTARADGDVEAGYHAGVAIQELMLGRFYTERFLLKNDQQSFDRAMGHFSTMQEKLRTLLAELQNPQRRRATEAAAKDVASYLEAAKDVRSLILRRNKIRAAELDTIGPALSDAYDGMLEAAVARQDRLGPQGANMVAMTQLLVIGIGIAALAIGGLLSWRFGRGISRDVRAMAGDMTALADGDLSLEIKGHEQKTELGLMAKALLVFRDNAEAAKAAAEAEAAEQAAAAERAAAMASLQGAIGEVVDGAVEGDFTRRIETRFTDPELAKLAEGVNAVMSTVDQGVRETGRVMSRIAEGDLSERMRGAFAGVFAELQSDVNGTVETLSDMVMKLTEHCEVIGRNSHDISAGADALSRRAGEQASALEETAATMEEMAASVKENADSATRANDMTRDASGRADKGGAIVGEAVGAMSSIEKSSGEISDIIAVIDGIAFQTNLLALNAAVEAARAGDAGKGFAVVASEVRTLAQRSSDASRDIRALIETSEGQVTQGVQLVEGAGSALGEIVEAIKQVDGVMASIASASGQQASGVEEISSAVSHLDEITQQNASMAEESASLARNLSGAADEMRRLVAFFRTSAASEAA